MNKPSKAALEATAKRRILAQTALRTWRQADVAPETIRWAIAWLKSECVHELSWKEHAEDMFDSYKSILLWSDENIVNEIANDQPVPITSYVEGKAAKEEEERVLDLVASIQEVIDGNKQTRWPTRIERANLTSDCANAIFRLAEDAHLVEKELLTHLAHAAGTHAEIALALAHTSGDRYAIFRHWQAAYFCQHAAEMHHAAQTTV